MRAATPGRVAAQIKAVKEAARFRDADVLGDLIQPQDRGLDFVSGDNNYAWWFVVGAALRPRRVVEIGTRFGYSLWSVVSGANHPPDAVSILAFDAEVDPGTKDPLAVCGRWFRGKGYRDVTLVKTDTQKTATIGREGLDPYDVAVVDADHSAVGCHHDMGLLLPHVRPGGVMVVDDTNPGEVRDGCERFCRERGLEWEFLPTLRGVHLVFVP